MITQEQVPAASVETGSPVVPMEDAPKTGLPLVMKAIRMMMSQGVGFSIRRTIWRLEYDKFQKLRNQTDHGANRPSSIRFLDEEFDLHPAKEGLSEELLFFGSHEPVSTHHYLRELSPGDHVLDIGSNIGYYLLLARRTVGPSGCLLGFEPAPAVYSILKRNIDRCGYKNVRTFPWAIGAKSGNAQFHDSQIPNWGSLLQDDRLLPTGSTQVEVRSADDLLEAFPDFRPTVLRMDVEGGELMVLEGARRLLEQLRPTLFIEFHPFVLGWERVRSALLELGQLGYRSGVMVHRNWDQPWIRKWVRERRCWSGPLERHIRRVDRAEEELANSTFTLILKTQP